MCLQAGPIAVQSCWGPEGSLRLCLRFRVFICQLPSIISEEQLPGEARWHFWPTLGILQIFRWPKKAPKERRTGQSSPKQSGWGVWGWRKWAGCQQCLPHGQTTSSRLWGRQQPACQQETVAATSLQTIFSHARCGHSVPEKPQI